MKNYHFDAVLDVTAYTGEDINLLLDALGSFGDYVLISSSAVYPEYETQPFTEEGILAANKFWGKYGTDKIEAEETLKKRVPNAYILRPPYLYGPMNNVYREAFAFDCTMQGRRFYLPKDVEKQYKFMPTVKPLKEGIREAFEWYKENADKVVKKPYMKYIDENFTKAE